MNNTYFAIPDSQSLTKITSWNQDARDKRRYSIIRSHYLLRGPFQLKEATKRGEVVSAATSLQGISQKKTYSTEYEQTSLDLEESIQEALREDETLREFRTSLSAGLNANPFGQLQSSLQAGASRRLKTAFNDSFRIQATQSQTVKKSVTWEYTIDPAEFDAKDTVVAVTAYKHYAYYLYLIYIDYLTVAYQRSPWGIIYKRHKIPPVTGNIHTNIIKVELPLCAIKFWQQLPDTLLPVKEKHYRNEVEDPLEVEISAFDKRKRFSIDPGSERTLYQLAEKAFPRKRLV